MHYIFKAAYEFMYSFINVPMTSLNRIIHSSVFLDSFIMMSFKARGHLTRDIT